MSKVVTVETGTGQSCDSRGMHRSVITGQTCTGQCGNSTDRHKSV